MNDLKVLIFSSSIDYSTDLICIELEKRNISYLRINRDQFHKFNIILDIDKPKLQIEFNKKIYFFNNEEFNSIYFRAPVFLRTINKLYSLNEQLYKTQWNAFLRNLIIFDKVRWLNNPVYTYRAENKMYQLLEAKRNGLFIPKTVVANTIIGLENEKNYVIKSIDTALFNMDEKEIFTYSNTLSGRDIKSSKSDFSNAPVFIQEYIENKIDIRVTYVFGKMYAIKILNNGKGISCDWRTIKKENLEYSTCRIPLDIENKLKLLMSSLKLNFGGIDLIESNDQFYFIEVNPTGEWGWIVGNTDYRIDKSIVDFLCFESV